MSAKVISFPRPTELQGNGAREALIDVGELLPNTTTEEAANWADWLFAEFWNRGFKVVPIDD